MLGHIMVVKMLMVVSPLSPPAICHIKTKSGLVWTRQSAKVQFVCSLAHASLACLWCLDKMAQISAALDQRPVSWSLFFTVWVQIWLTVASCRWIMSWVVLTKGFVTSEAWEIGHFWVSSSIVHLRNEFGVQNPLNGTCPTSWKSHSDWHLGL